MFGVSLVTTWWWLWIYDDDDDDDDDDEDDEDDEEEDGDDDDEEWWRWYFANHLETWHLRLVAFIQGYPSNPIQSWSKLEVNSKTEK